MSTEAEGHQERRTVLVTRPRPQAVATARAIHKSGHRAIIDPLLAVQNIPHAPADPSGLGGVLLTSANAVIGLHDRLAHLPVFAVGGATASAARRRGPYEVKVADGDAGMLADLVRRTLEPATGELLHLSGEDVRPELEARLTAAGYGFRRLVVYRAVAATSLAPRTLRALNEAALDAVLFFSPRTAGVFNDLVDAAGLGSRLAGTTALCLSEDVARRTRGLPWAGVLVAERRTQEALLARLEALTGTC